MGVPFEAQLLRDFSKSLTYRRCTRIVQQMKTHRSAWPQVREIKRGKKSYWLVDMRRTGYTGQKWKTLPDKKRALEFASELRKKVDATGTNSISKLNLDPRIKV